MSGRKWAEAEASHAHRRSRSPPAITAAKARPTSRSASNRRGEVCADRSMWWRMVCRLVPKEKDPGSAAGVVGAWELGKPSGALAARLGGLAGVLGAGGAAAPRSRRAAAPRLRTAAAGTGGLQAGGPAARLGLRAAVRSASGDAELVVDVADAGEVLDGFLGEPLLLTAVDRAGQRHLAVVHLDGDAAGIDLPVAGERLADLFLDALAGALIALGTTARVRTLPLLAGLLAGVAAARAVAVAAALAAAQAALAAVAALASTVSTLAAEATLTTLIAIAALAPAKATLAALAAIAALAATVALAALTAVAALAATVSTLATLAALAAIAALASAKATLAATVALAALAAVSTLAALAAVATLATTAETAASISVSAPALLTPIPAAASGLAAAGLASIALSAPLLPTSAQASASAALARTPVAVALLVALFPVIAVGHVVPPCQMFPLTR